jgi:hypothetical protein
MLPEALTTVPGGKSAFSDFTVSGDCVRRGENSPVIVGVGGVTVVTALKESAIGGVFKGSAGSTTWGVLVSIKVVVIDFGKGGGGLADLFEERFSERLLLRLRPPRRV